MRSIVLHKEIEGGFHTFLYCIKVAARDTYIYRLITYPSRTELHHPCYVIDYDTKIEALAAFNSLPDGD